MCPRFLRPDFTPARDEIFNYHSLFNLMLQAVNHTKDFQSVDSERRLKPFIPFALHLQVLQPTPKCLNFCIPLQLKKAKMDLSVSQINPAILSHIPSYLLLHGLRQTS